VNLEFSERSNRDGAGGFYLHIASKRPTLIRAVYAALQAERDKYATHARKMIERYAKDREIPLTELENAMAWKKWNVTYKLGEETHTTEAHGPLKDEEAVKAHIERIMPETPVRPPAVFVSAELIKPAQHVQTEVAGEASEPVKVEAAEPSNFGQVLHGSGEVVRAAGSAEESSI